MTEKLTEIYSTHSRGTQGFCSEISTHCGLDISKAEISRIASRAETPEQFLWIWENVDWWTDKRN